MFICAGRRSSRRERRLGIYSFDGRIVVVTPSNRVVFHEVFVFFVNFEPRRTCFLGCLHGPRAKLN